MSRATFDRPPCGPIIFYTLLLTPRSRSTMRNAGPKGRVAAAQAGVRTRGEVEKQLHHDFGFAGVGGFKCSRLPAVSLPALSLPEGSNPPVVSLPKGIATCTELACPELAEGSSAEVRRSFFENLE